MTFGEVAWRLAAHTAVTMGWRPDDFWNATPAELLGILQAIAGDVQAPPSTVEMQELMSRFPDAPNGER